MKISFVDLETRKVLGKVVIDVAIFGCFLTFYSILDDYGQPFRRGFFCNDESLLYPYAENTVDSSLELIGFGLPTAVIAITEFTRWKLSVDGNQQRVKLFNRDIPFWAVNVYKNVGLFLFGAFVNILTTDIGKHTLGRLRPHFMSVCQPIMSGGTTCSDPINLHRYIEDYSCGNVGSSADRLKQMRLSFPSGHSSFSMYTMFFAAIYLQCRMTWKGSKLLKHSMQFLFVMTAWFTALSRISDYKHHWSDVFFGSFLGIVVCVITIFGVSDLFKPVELRKEQQPDHQAPPTTSHNSVTSS